MRIVKNAPPVYVQPPAGYVPQVSAPVPSAALPTDGAAAPAAGAAAPAVPQGHVVTSPMVGTFYRAPSPGADPFVQVGDT
ncbi:acetyl-CoA carboxylase, biotin carboxyl carrier protein, partial [Clostridioides difficile]|nr:acetyl-CoA carboxylase, biotin carboxyl carrier protein [Clostridioides difficile]